MNVKTRFDSEPIERAYKPTRVYRFFVTGRGDFPFDMLRYDKCWPRSADDAAKLHTPEGEERRKHRSIEMMSYKEPTVDRWSSFIWSVGTERLVP